MKQSEINKVLNQVIKEVGKKFNWKSKGGFLFTKKDLLFFDLIVLAQGKNKKISVSVYYKLFDFDEIFWKIVCLEENLNQPLSFHADGAWTAPTMCIDEMTIENDDWSESNLSEKVSSILKKADELSSQLAKEISTLDENLAYTETLFANLLNKHPNAVTTIYREKLMTALLKKEYSLALTIAEERISKNDNGGFSAGSKSFYVLAKEYIEKNFPNRKLN